MKVALCLIVKNEAENLPRCLASVAGVVDEIVVGDTGSTDDTVALAERAGARVVHVPWTNDFSKARNAVLDATAGDWIVSLDADEELATGSAATLREVLASTTADALSLTIENLLPDTEVARSSDVPAVRVFRSRPEHRFERPLHEQIRPAIERRGGRVERSSLRIIHHGYRSALAQGTSRTARNAAVLDKGLQRAPRDPWLHYHMGLTAKAAASHTRAQKHLELALRHDGGHLDPSTRARIACTFAQISLGAQKNAEAASHARRALVLAPDDLLALHILALATMFLGDVRGSLPLFEEVRRSPQCNATRYAELDQIIAFARAAPQSAQ